VAQKYGIPLCLAQDYFSQAQEFKQ
jgi:hypothetical protein